MSPTKQLAADALFCAQIVLTVVFCGKQLAHMVQNGAFGVNIMMFVSVEAFVLINLVLAIRAHCAQGSRVTLQAVIAYAVWVVLWGLNLPVLLWHMFVVRTVGWGIVETATTGVLLLSLGIIHQIARAKGVAIDDPLVRGAGALAFKALPQIAQGWKFLTHGGAGFSPVSILVGHLTILIRIGQLWFSIREAGWERNRLASFVSEVGNEVGWILATAAWLWWRFS